MSQLEKYSTDFPSFALDLHMPQLGRYGNVATACQRAEVGPSLLAVATGDKPLIRRFWLEATKGYGKDSLHAIAGLWLLAFSRRAVRVQVGANDQSQADEFRQICRDTLRLNSPLNKIVANVLDVQRTSIMCPRNGSSAEILTKDALGSHGSRPDLVLINELSHIGDREFAETLFDNSDKMPKGIAMLASNAGHIDTWQQDWRNIAIESDRWHVTIWDKPAPYIDEKDLAESKKRNTLSRFRRLWHGEWVRGDGDAIDLEDIEAAINDSLEIPTAQNPVALRQAYKRSHSFIGGLDLSTKRDHSAFIVLAINSKKQTIHVAHVRSWKPINGTIDLQAVRAGVLETCRTYGCRRVVFDPFQAALMAQDLKRKRIVMIEQPFSGSGCNKMASTILEMFRSRDTLTMPREGTEDLRRDLGRLLIVERQFGYKLEASKDAQHGHADTAFALAIALPEAVRRLRSRASSSCRFAVYSPGQYMAEAPLMPGMTYTPPQK